MDRQKNEMRRLSVKFTSWLSYVLHEQAEVEFSEDLRFAVWLLEIVLEIAQAEKRFRLFPQTMDLGKVESEPHQFVIRKELYDFLMQFSRDQNKPISSQVREFLWIGLEAHREVVRGGYLFQREELKKRIARVLELRFLFCTFQ